MDIKDFYLREKTNLEDLLETSHNFPQHKENLEKLIKKGLKNVTEILVMIEDHKNAKDEAKNLLGPQRPEETENQFAERVTRLGKATKIVVDFHSVFEKKQKKIAASVLNINKYTEEMVKKIYDKNGDPNNRIF